MTALTLPPASATAPRQPADRTSLVNSCRVPLDLPPRSMERLSTLKRKTEATSYAEVVKNALRLNEALIEESEAGQQLLARDATGVVSPYRLFR